MLECRWGVEEAGLNWQEGGEVVVDNGMPKLSGMVFGHLHDLICVTIADVVGWDIGDTFLNCVKEVSLFDLSYAVRSIAWKPAICE